MRLVQATMILLGALISVADGVGTSSMAQISAEVSAEVQADGWRKKLKKAAKAVNKVSNFVPGPLGMALGAASNLATNIPTKGSASPQALMTQFSSVPGVGNLASSVPGMSNLASVPGMSNLASVPGMSNLASVPGMGNLAANPSNLISQAQQQFQTQNLDLGALNQQALMANPQFTQMVTSQALENPQFAGAIGQQALMANPQFAGAMANPQLAGMINQAQAAVPSVWDGAQAAIQSPTTQTVVDPATGQQVIVEEVADATVYDPTTTMIDDTSSEVEYVDDGLASTVAGATTYPATAYANPASTAMGTAYIDPATGQPIANSYMTQPYQQVTGLPPML